MAPSYVLVTGATGFIGANVVDCLLKKGLKVRGADRSATKGEQMLAARPQYAGKLDFVTTKDFSNGAQGVYDGAVEGVDGIIHVASPFKYDVKSNEQELVLPAINGVRSILTAAVKQPAIKRIVLTSSFASVLDDACGMGPGFTYTGADWNPLSYEESIDPQTPAFIAYRGSKKFAELAAWNFVRESQPAFDLVTICPPMTFGPIVHPISAVKQLNESNSMLWSIASGVDPLPVARVPVWMDVRDLAAVHVEALLRPEAGGKRYVPAAPDKFSYQLAADIMREVFPWAKDKVSKGDGRKIPETYELDGETVARELGIHYHSFRETVVDVITQIKAMADKEVQVNSSVAV